MYVSQVLEIARLLQSNLTLNYVRRCCFGLLPLVSDCFEYVSNDKSDQSWVTPTLYSVDHHAQNVPVIWYVKVLIEQCSTWKRVVTIVSRISVYRIHPNANLPGIIFVLRLYAVDPYKYKSNNQ